MKASDREMRKKEKLRVELLIATMHQKDDSILNRMHVQSDAIVINQCEPFAWREFKRDSYRIRFLSCGERGVGLSRNTALMRAERDICLFSDDDLIYRDGYEEKIIQAFEDFPEADVLVFNIQSIDNKKSRYQIQKPPLSIPKPTTFYIPRLFQLLNGSANTVYTILADAGKPLCGIIPIFWQGQHERKQTFCFQGKLPVTQMMVCHDGVISGFVYTKYCDNSSPLFAGAFGGAESAPAHNGPGLRFRR